MKRFLMFLVIAIAVTSLGLSIYYFAKDNEVIFINNTQLSVNAGDTFKADDLLTFQNASKYTKVDYSGVKDSKVLTYNKKEGYYAAVKGGETKIVITTNNRAYSSLVIKVIVRDGTEEFPYIIDSEEELRLIGSEGETKFTSAAHYELGKSIILTEKWTPIENFTGSINGAGFTISNLDISAYTTEEIEATKVDNAGTMVDTPKTEAYNAYNLSLGAMSNAGLVGTLAVDDTTGVVGKVFNLNLKNVNIKGDFEKVGAIAAENNGEIRNCAVSTDSYVKYEYFEGEIVAEETIYNNIQSTKAGAFVGAITGLNTTATKTIGGVDKNYVPVLDRVSSSARMYVNASQEVGGLAGRNVGGQITESYFDGYAFSQTAGLNFGGIAYSNIAGTAESSIIDCYTAVNTLTAQPIGTVGGILYVNTPTGLDETKEHHIYGTYYAKVKSYNDAGVYTEIDIDTFATGDSTYAKNSRLLEIAEFTNKSLFVTYVEVIGASDYTRRWDFENVWKMGETAPVLNRDSNSGSIYLIDYSSVKGSNDLSQSDSAQDIYDALATGTGSWNIANDIDMANFVWNPIASFNGTLTGASVADGNGGERPVIVSNIVIVVPKAVVNGQTTEMQDAGLFVELTKDAIINNITFKNITIKAAADNLDNGGRYVGTLAAVSRGANIANVSVINVDVENLFLTGFGGLIGYNDYEANHAVVNVSASDVEFIGSYAQMAAGIAAVNNAIISGTEAKGTLPATYVTASDIKVVANIVGGVVAYNYRTVLYARGLVSTTVTIDNDKVYGVMKFVQLGGIAGYNKNTGLIKNVDSAATFNVDTVKGYSVYVGGTVGYNAGTIYFASVKNTMIVANKSYKVYAGGIAGLSSGVIYGCFVDTTTEITASTTAIEKHNESHVGGLVGGLANASSANKVGSVSNSIAKPARLQGFYVGGLIGYSYGSVTRCYVEGTSIKGFFAGGLAGIINTVISNGAPIVSYDGNNSGLFKYDYAVVTIENTNSTIDMSALSQAEIYNSVATLDRGASAGIAVLVVYGSEVDNCYTVTNFIGGGVKASTTISRECGNSDAATRKTAISGVIKNTIYTNKQTSIGKEGGKFVEETTLRPGEGVSYKVFVNNGFDTAVWKAEIGELPTISGLDSFISTNTAA